MALSAVRLVWSGPTLPPRPRLPEQANRAEALNALYVRFTLHTCSGLTALVARERGGSRYTLMVRPGTHLGPSAFLLSRGPARPTRRGFVEPGFASRAAALTRFRDYAADPQDPSDRDTVPIPTPGPRPLPAGEAGG